MATAFDITTMDNSNWMGELPASFTNRPIHTIAIPGSHNSFTYSISTSMGISPDEPEIQCFGQIPCIGPVAKPVVYNWSLTQNKTCVEQLEIGVRYFDFRLAPYPKTGTVNIVHGLFGMAVENSLKELMTFLKTHPKDIVLLDFQHFYKTSVEDHIWLIERIKSIFSSSLCPVVKNLNNLTLEYLWNHKYQALVFYRWEGCPPEFWPSCSIPNPWPNTDDGKKLWNFLQNNYEQGRPQNKFYVTQVILTPGREYVVWHLLSKLSGLSKQANKLLLEWSIDKEARGLNVVLCDFADTDLTKFIIDINYK